MSLKFNNTAVDEVANAAINQEGTSAFCLYINLTDLVISVILLIMYEYLTKG